MGQGLNFGSTKEEGMVTWCLWELLFSIFGVSWVFPLRIRETLLGWNGSFVGKKQFNVWKVAPLCIFWSIWRERE